VQDTIFLPRYPEPRKVPTNPHWCPYAKDSPCEGQSPQKSNFVESRGPFHAQVVLRFWLKHHGPRFLRYTVATMTQTWLSWSRKTLAPLSTILKLLAQEPRVFLGFSKLTQLTRNNLEQERISGLTDLNTLQST
jgi:hypothetical protein